MEAKLDLLIKEVSNLTEQTKQLKQENIEIRAQIAEMKSRLNHEDEEIEEEEEQQSSGFLCIKPKKRDVAPPGRTTHPTRGGQDNHELGAPGATTHPSRGAKKPLPVFKPKGNQGAGAVDSKPEYNKV